MKGMFAKKTIHNGSTAAIFDRAGITHYTDVISP
jgi:hypothetical protein